MDRLTQLQAMSTFDLAFNLAQNKYNDTEKFQVLDIIRSRDIKDRNVENFPTQATAKSQTSIKAYRKPLKGSKSEKIEKLVMEGKTAREVYDILNKRGIKVYYPEIYRLLKAHKDNLKK